MKVPFLAGKREISLDSLIPFKCLICLDIIRWSIIGQEKGERERERERKKKKRTRRSTISLNSRSMNRKAIELLTLVSRLIKIERIKGKIFAKIFFFLA